MSALEHPALDGDATRLQTLHGQMVEALLDGGGLHAVARLAAAAAGGRVVIALNHEGLAAAAPSGDGAERGPTLRLPIASGDEVLGTVALHGADPDGAAADALRAAAMATLTYIALLRDDADADAPGARLVEAVLDGLPDAQSRLSAAGLGDAAALCVAVPDGRRGAVLAALADHAPGSARTIRDGWAHALLPRAVDGPRLATDLHERLGVAAAAAGTPAALPEARLAAQLVADGAASARAVGGGTWRLLLRAALHLPGDVEALAAQVLGPVDEAGERLAGTLLATFATYLAEGCNMNATAAAMPAHRHTVAYRLERLRELTALDPLVPEDREQLGLALKARAVATAARRAGPARARTG